MGAAHLAATALFAAALSTAPLAALASNTGGTEVTVQQANPPEQPKQEVPVHELDQTGIVAFGIPIAGLAVALGVFVLHRGR